MKYVMVRLVTSLLLFTGAAGAAPSLTDTTQVLGGPGRWDGRFETAAGDPDWQGWTHADLYETAADRWQVSDFHAANLGGHGPGNLAAWCGAVFDNACGPGYGNDWATILDWTWPVPDPAESLTVRIEARLNVDTESGYDYVRLYHLRGDVHNYLALWTATVADSIVDVTVLLGPDDYHGGSSDLVRVYWQVESDGGWSDEDCLLDTEGACQIDDLRISFDGEEVSFTDFEDGSFGDWTPRSYYDVGDFTQLWHGLEDIDPDPAHQNGSWQVAFIDDGVVVPETGGTPCVNWCYGPDGWVFNVTAGRHGHGVPGGPIPLGNSGVWNAVVSPALAWPEGAEAGRLAFDVYAHTQTEECGFTTYGWALRATAGADPEDLEAEDWQPTRWSYWNQATMPSGPGYFRLEPRLDDLLPAGTRWVQVRLEALEVGPYCWGWYVFEGTPAPYFDNVAITAWSAVTDVPEALRLSLRAWPNPFNPAVRLRWSQPVAGRVDLRVFDARGRHVRTVLDADRAAGTGEVTWDGRDDEGRAVSAGTYLVRLRTADGECRRKLSLVR